MGKAGQGKAGDSRHSFRGQALAASTPLDHLHSSSLGRSLLARAAAGRAFAITTALASVEHRWVWKGSRNEPWRAAGGGPSTLELCPTSPSTSGGLTRCTPPPSWGSRCSPGRTCSRQRRTCNRPCRPIQRTRGVRWGRGEDKGISCMPLLWPPAACYGPAHATAQRTGHGILGGLSKPVCSELVKATNARGERLWSASRRRRRPCGAPAPARGSNRTVPVRVTTTHRCRHVVGP